MSFRFSKAYFLGIGCVFASFFMGMTGCDEEQAGPVLHQKKEPVVPIALPDRPNFDSIIDSSISREKGIMTTWEAVFRQKDYLNKTVHVKGVITEVSEDCPTVTLPPKLRKRALKGEEPESKFSYKCRNLYVKIKSPDSSDKSILVTGYHPYYHPHLKPGMELDVTGNYMLYAHGFVEPVTGLITSKELHGMAVSKKGQFTTDRKEISEMIAKREIVGMRK